MGAIVRRAGLAAAVAALAVLAPAAPAQEQRTLTLAADRHDVISPKGAVVLSGRLDPPPGDFEERDPIEIVSEVPGVQDSTEGVGTAYPRPDGTFSLTVRPATNTRYRAFLATNRDVVSADVLVYADYGIRVAWRRRSRSRIEAAAILTIRALEADYLDTRRIWFYGLRRGARSARRLFAAKVFYTADGSGAHPAAYAVKRVARPRRVHRVLACMTNPPFVFGRPDDPVKRQCGRRRLVLPPPA